VDSNVSEKMTISYEDVIMQKDSCPFEGTMDSYKDTVSYEGTALQGQQPHMAMTQKGSSTMDLLFLDEFEDQIFNFAGWFTRTCGVPTHSVTMDDCHDGNKGKRSPLIKAINMAHTK
jgi:hypothetical protein